MSRQRAACRQCPHSQEWHIARGDGSCNFPHCGCPDYAPVVTDSPRALKAEALSCLDRDGVIHPDMALRLIAALERLSAIEHRAEMAARFPVDPSEQIAQYIHYILTGES